MRSWGARRLATAGIASGTVAFVSTLVAAAGASDGADAGSDSGWILGVVLLLGPVISACLTRSVVASVLLRPVGVVAVVFAAMTAAVHVGVAVDDGGALGWVYGAPAIVTALALGAAVVAGRDRPAELPARSGTEPVRSQPDEEVVDGPALDVISPLRDARSHAGTAVVAWAAVIVVALAVSPPALRLLGWPVVEESLVARVAGVDRNEEGVVVAFLAERNGETLHWQFEADSTEWEKGDLRVVHLGDDGRVHFDRQFGLAGAPMIVPIAFVGLFGVVGLRRWWGLVVAVADASRGVDEPRLGYVALLRPPRQWRPLTAVWWKDPTGGQRLSSPDAVYRVDDETGEELVSVLPAMVVHRAWVDTGAWRGAKPRWIGSSNGVLVPHRRALFGGWQFRLLTRRADVDGPMPLRHTSPQSASIPPSAVSAGAKHSLRGMVAWRMLAVPCAIAAAIVTGPGGDAVRHLQ